MVKTVTLPDNAIESGASHLWLDEDGILVFINKPVPVHDLKDAMENLEFSKRISLGKPRPLLVDMTATKSMSREAREEYAKAGVDSVVTAIALVTKSSMSRIVANFFLSFNKTSVPTRLFNNAERAKGWLMQYK